MQHRVRRDVLPPSAARSRSRSRQWSRSTHGHGHEQGHGHSHGQVTVSRYLAVVNGALKGSERLVGGSLASPLRVLVRRMRGELRLTRAQQPEPRYRRAGHVTACRSNETMCVLVTLPCVQVASHCSWCARHVTVRVGHVTLRAGQVTLCDAVKIRHALRSRDRACWSRFSVAKLLCAVVCGVRVLRFLTCRSGHRACWSRYILRCDHIAVRAVTLRGVSCSRCTPVRGHVTAFRGHATDSQHASSSQDCESRHVSQSR